MYTVQYQGWPEGGIRSTDLELELWSIRSGCGTQTLQTQYILLTNFPFYRGASSRDSRTIVGHARLQGDLIMVTLGATSRLILRGSLLIADVSCIAPGPVL